MDSEKLHRILNDLKQDEAVLGIDGKIGDIRNDISQNTPEAFSSAETRLTELITQIKETSIIYEFSQSEQLMLEHIKGDLFFGRGLVSRLEKIFNSRSFELLTKIDELRTQRNDFIQKAQKLADGFAGMGIKEYRPNAYEVGFIIPEDQNDMESVLKRVGELEFLLSGLSEAVDGDHTPVKITRASNGTLEFFSLQSLEVAVLLTTLLANIVVISEAIAKIFKKITDVDKEEYSDETKETIKSALKKETQNIKKQIIEDLPKKFLATLDKGRAHEIKNQISISVKAIFAWFELGIEVDVTPVRVPDAGTPPDAESEKQVAEIQNTNMKLKDIYKLPPELRKLPFELPAVAKEETIEDKPVDVEEKITEKSSVKKAEK